jgi:hypothetical protein
MSKQIKTIGKKTLATLGMVAVLLLLFQTIGQASDLDQQLMEAATNGDDNHVMALLQSSIPVCQDLAFSLLVSSGTISNKSATA